MATTTGHLTLHSYVSKRKLFFRHSEVRQGTESSETFCLLNRLNIVKKDEACKAENPF